MSIDGVFELSEHQLRSPGFEIRIELDEVFDRGAVDARDGLGRDNDTSDAVQDPLHGDTCCGPVHGGDISQVKPREGRRRQRTGERADHVHQPLDLEHGPGQHGP
ncbi:hypothetical protein [Arthrobacter sp. CJ23]|uniref:hypothetical protein n=1 Tax=Arthrobacter sp. CJ23 TaxID=2972479 RepID=UPI00215D1C96|nr:hypothetical protein [Arthrobacter sp. CJ23]UVJ41270.1 hypothetical protein NVV90_09070 [Arthrobacter sp. CJ23]